MLARTTPAASILRGLFHDFDQSSVLPLAARLNMHSRAFRILRHSFERLRWRISFRPRPRKVRPFLTLDGALGRRFDLGFGFLGLGCGRLCHVLGLGCGRLCHVLGLGCGRLRRVLGLGGNLLDGTGQGRSTTTIFACGLADSSSDGSDLTCFDQLQGCLDPGFNQLLCGGRSPPGTERRSSDIGILFGNCMRTVINCPISL